MVNLSFVFFSFFFYFFFISLWIYFWIITIALLKLNKIFL
jgi:hypothetical protein